MFAPRGANSPPARHRREAPALWAVAAKGGKATRRCAGRKRVPSGHLPPKVAKRPEGVSKYKGCARPARRTPIFARERNERRARPASSAKIERPGKAGRYELTLEGRRALQTSRKGFVSDLGRPTGRLFFAWVEKEAKNAPKPCKKRKSPSDDPPMHPSFPKGPQTKKPAKIMPKPYEKKEET